MPAYGSLALTVGGATVESALNREGVFYFENVAPGRYPATVTDAVGPCVFEVTIPAANTLLTDLGQLTCRRAPDAGGGR